MIRNCDNCGGPIEGSAYAAQWKCDYCGRTVFKTSVQRAAGAPAVRAPVVRGPVVKRTASPRPASVPPVHILAFGLVLSMVLSAVGWGVFLFASGSHEARPNPVRVNGQPVSPIREWDGLAPLRCGAGERVHARALDVIFATDVALDIQEGCQVTLEQVQIRAPRAALLRGGTLILTGSTLRTTGDGVAITGRAPAVLVLSGASAIASGSAAVHVEGPARIRCTGSQVEGSPTAIRFVRGGGAVEGENCREIDRP